MVMNKMVRSGILAAEVLKVVCEDPENAYAHAITKVLNERRGDKYVHNLQVGVTLHLLATDGVLKAEEPMRGPKSSVPRKMYSPTWKAGLYLGLSEMTT